PASSLMIRRPPRPTLFPYTTLFRSITVRSPATPCAPTTTTPDRRWPGWPRWASTSTTSSPCSSVKVSRSSSRVGTSCWSRPRGSWRRRSDDEERSADQWDGGGEVTSEPLAVTVHSGGWPEAVEKLVSEQVASRIAAKDATLWGPDAEAEASIRLGWTDLHETSRPLLAEIEALSAELRAEGLDRIVLAGMGGSSLAPEVITRTAGVELTVLDTTDPGAVQRALHDRLERTVLVVSSKSGSTVETDSQRRVFEAAFTAAGIDAASRIVAVTDPGSGLADRAAEAGYRRLFLADPNVGGRYSALTAFGLVPSGLAGADVAALLDGAASVAAQLAADAPDNPALILGAALGASGRDKVAIADAGSGISGFGDWAEQLLAESTGKDGTGILPIAVAGTEAPEVRQPASDVLVALLGQPDAAVTSGAAPTISVQGSLGAQFLLWEFATAVAGRLLGINPFDQPDVESAKAAARGLLDAPPQPSPPAFAEGGIEVRGPEDLLQGV